MAAKLRIKWWMVAIVSLSGALGGAYSYIDYETDRRLEKMSPVDRAMRRALKGLDTDQDRRFHKTFAGLSPVQVRAKSLELGRLGTRRLRANDQVQRVRLAGALLNAAPTEPCAGFVRGTNTPDQALQLIDNLDSASLDVWADVSLKAILAEIAQTTPAVQTAAADIEGAGDAVLKAFDSAQAEVVIAGFQPTPHTPAEDCALGRLLYNRVDALPEADQAGYARALTIFEAVGQDSAAATPKP